jgi:hypothetical protein
MQGQLVVAVASATVAALSAGVSMYYSRRSTWYAQRSAQNQYEGSMRLWAETTVDVTGELVELLSRENGEREFNERSGQLRARLRCQIDKGRWYFPNVHPDLKGSWKPPAFRGIRQRILNVLVDFFDAVDKADWSDRQSAFTQVEGLHREFVSEVQQRLDPTTRDDNYQKFVAQYQDMSSQFVQESLQRPDRPHDESGDKGPEFPGGVQPVARPAADARSNGRSSSADRGCAQG